MEITVKEKVNLNFSIKYLSSFTKATSLSVLRFRRFFNWLFFNKFKDRVSLSMCDNVPLVVHYDIEGNGYLRFFLAPKIDEDKEGMDE